MAFITGNTTDATETLCDIFDNYEGMYNDKIRFIQGEHLEEGEELDPFWVEKFCKGYFCDGQFNDERWSYHLKDVDFDEVAENWNQDR